MTSYLPIQWSMSVTSLLFFSALGAICGSFVNVLAYRLPRGMNVVSPPSACPMCETRLTWRENFPILGWIWLRGRCRFCKSPIAAQYPIVEVCMALLFALVFVLWYMHPSLLELADVKRDVLQPAFAKAGLDKTWPFLGAVYILLVALAASTLIDARTFTIPLVLPWVASVAGLMAHTLHGIWVQWSLGSLPGSDDAWTIPVPEGPWLGMTIGGALGLLLAMVLLRRGLMPRSFDDYEAWEKAHLESRPEAGAPESTAAQASPAPSLRTVLLRTLFLTGPALALMFVGLAIGLRFGRPLEATAIGMGIGLIVGLLLRRLVGASGDPHWVEYPHARREMLKELLFLAPAIGLALVGWWLASGPLKTTTDAAPLWVRAAGGSALGYMVGGGLIWGLRILGSLALGREAMGQGDTHLLAAAGAVLGWFDPVLAFFTAPFLGIVWAALSVVWGRVFHRQGTALPYGPHLAIAVVLVLLGRPVFAAFLTIVLGRDVQFP